MGMLRGLLPLLSAGLCLASATAFAATPSIAIVMDDMGDRVVEGARIVALPGPVACAVLPATPHGAKQAGACHARGKEVLLHFPLQPQSGKAHPLAVTTRSTRDELRQRLRSGLDGLPHVDGVNIHQGSLLSQRAQPMHWMMAELRERGSLYFVDSYTSGGSVALPVAEDWGLSSTKRQVFLDADPGNAVSAQEQFKRLITLAHRQGSALAIGHPFPETLALLERELPQLAKYGVQLIAPSALIALQQGARPAPKRRPVKLQLSATLSPATTGLAPPRPALH